MSQGSFAARQDFLRGEVRSAQRCVFMGMWGVCLACMWVALFFPLCVVGLLVLHLIPGAWDGESFFCIPHQGGRRGLVALCQLQGVR